MSEWSLLEGDCVEVLASIEAGSADAIVTDPPYGIDFQGEDWDGRQIRASATRMRGAPLTPGEAFELWTASWAEQALRVVKPGAFLAAFGSPRTAHRLACGLERAGFELRDCLIWLYGTGMPKSRKLPGGKATTLKPAYEPILLARRPPEGPIEENLAIYETGALNVEACRVERRFPANVVVSHDPDCRPGECGPTCAVRLTQSAAEATRANGRGAAQISRLFYCPKSSRRERDAGCEELPQQDLDLFPNARNGSRPPKATNPHPTVKPLVLMRWLTRLVVPADGLVLDPFCGSGSTGCAAVLEDRRFLGIEREASYAAIARTRIEHWERAASGGR